MLFFILFFSHILICRIHVFSSVMTLAGCKKDARHSKFPAQGWSGWSAWGECSKSCGDGGFHVRHRPCGTRPDCDGHEVQKMTCVNMAPCNASSPTVTPRVLGNISGEGSEEGVLDHWWIGGLVYSSVVNEKCLAPCVSLLSNLTSD